MSSDDLLWKSWVVDSLWLGCWESIQLFQDCSAGQGSVLDAHHQAPPAGHSLLNYGDNYWDHSFPVLPGPNKPSRPHSPKTMAILGPLTATHNKIFCCTGFLGNTTTEPNVRGEILIFFLNFILHFMMKSWTNLLNLARFVSWHLEAIHGHFHGHTFSTAPKLFIRPHFWKVALATATWQVCQCCQVLRSLHGHIHLNHGHFGISGPLTTSNKLICSCARF